MEDSAKGNPGMKHGEDVRALLVLDEEYGANFLVEDGIPNIRNRLREYGWNLTTAAVREEIRPCAWGFRNAGQTAFRPDLRVRDLGNPDMYDVVILLPGKSQANLRDDPEFLAFLRRAADRGTVIAAWCRASRILAAAGILEGVHVAGRPEHRAEYEAAGAFPAVVPSLSEAPPPISDRGIVTTLRSKFYRTAMCEEIRKTLDAAVPARAFRREPPRDGARTLAAAFFARTGMEREARLLVDSLRTFGGSLRDSPVRILHPADSPLREGPDRGALENLGADLVPFRGDPRVLSYPLSAKVAAAAEAERRADGTAEVLAWLDADTIFLAEPSEFLLPPGISLAVRPVHHRLIGSLFDEPLPELWRILYEREAVPPGNVAPMITTLDRERIRPYFNAGCLVVRPELRLLRTWYSELSRSVRDPDLTGECEKVPLGPLFLHQAVLSAVILSRVPRGQVSELPFRYNYPLALHEDCPPDLKPASWNSLATLRYDDMKNLLGDAWRVLPAEGALGDWLSERLRP